MLESYIGKVELINRMLLCILWHVGQASDTADYGVTQTL